MLRWQDITQCSASRDGLGHVLKHGLAYGHLRFRSHSPLPAGTVHWGLNPTGVDYTPESTGPWYPRGAWKLVRPGRSGDKELLICISSSSSLLCHH